MYLTAEQIGIKEEERNALLEVKEFLKTLRNPEKPESMEDHEIGEVQRKAPAVFSMNVPLVPYDCGTGACIGGWMSVFMCGIKLAPEVAIPYERALEANRYVNSKARSDYNGPLRRLFFPKYIEDYETITPERAIEEIETFLTTGKATW